MDTCCIDMTNKAELREAINSMFQWYQHAGTCLAYLGDIPPRSGELSTSRWFTRGWTRQELIAPYNMVFLASDWTCITSEITSPSLLSRITGVPTSLLLGEELHHVSMAMRISWAAGRLNTKVEDKAYCFLGMFNIHVPLYEERQSCAFRRLQQELTKDSDDQSIFARTTCGSQVAQREYAAE